MAMDYFELAQASSLRMCWELEKRFPDFRGKQLELMRYLCLVAYSSEIYDGVCQDAWLRTTIKLKNHHPHIFSHSESTKLLDRRMQNVFHILSLSSSIEIRSNILPRRAYWERQQELQSSSFWTRVPPGVLLQLSMLDYWRIIFCGLNRRGFFPLTVLVGALEEGAPLTQKVIEWRQNGGISCDLETHFRRSDRDVPHACLRDTLRKIKRDDVEFSMEKDVLGTGSSGKVYKVVWKHGTYAMKSYKYSHEYQKELDIASKVLHTHIVHGFGYCVLDGQSCLLMEVLTSTLSDYAVEKARGRRFGPSFLFAEPLFSSVDTFDVLLQIARALEHCHDNNVVHGDLKPQNILFDHFEMLGNGRHFLAKVTDFSDAQSIIPGRAFRPVGSGTTQYAAPELLKWRVSPHEVEFADPKKIDVYGFGAVAHEVLTGYPVYHGCDYPIAEFKKDVIKGDLKPCESNIWRNSRLKERFPAGLIDLVEQCWEVRPENRPSFAEIRVRLVQLRNCMDQSRRNNIADSRKFFAAAYLMVYIYFTTLVEDRRVADLIEFMALILFAFLSMSLLMKFCVGCLISWVR